MQISPKVPLDEITKMLANYLLSLISQITQNPGYLTTDSSLRIGQQFIVTSAVAERYIGSGDVKLRLCDFCVTRFCDNDVCLF